jgi:protein-tyrosine phosphatase
LLAVGSGVAAIVATQNAWGRAVLWWAALAFAIVAAAYACGSTRILMKRQNGEQPLWGWLILWPYFLLARFSFWLYRITHRGDPAIAEVVPGLWFGRRMTAREAQAAGIQWAGVLDLAAEFPRARSTSERYLSIPLLDGAVAMNSQLQTAVAWLSEELPRGPVLVHCALGHGRTGSVVLSWLLVNGHIPDAATGVARLSSLRRGFGLSDAQLASVENMRQTAPPARSPA